MKKNIYIGIGLVFLFMIIVFLTRNNTITIPIVLTLYFIVGLKSNKIDQLLVLISPILIVWLLHFFDEDSMISVVIFYLVFIPIVSFLGFYFRKKWGIFKYLFVLFFIPIGLYVFPYWFEFYQNLGTRINKKSPPIELYTENNSVIRLDTIKNKIIVLDFWNTTCGVCFKKFPDFERISNDFKGDANIEFYAVNIPLQNDTIDHAKSLFIKQNLDFVSLYAKNNNISNSLEFNSFPHLIIIKNGMIRYNGRLIIEKEISHNLKDELITLLNEDK